MQFNKSLPIVVGSVLLLLLLGIGGLFVINSADRSRMDIPVVGNVPPFSSVKQDGASFGLDDLRGKISIVDFIFTSCRGACPVLSANMADLYREFKNIDGIQFVSITTDPARDSLAVLRDYAKTHGVDNNQWVFLWLPLSDLTKLSESGFALPADGFPEGHSENFVLVDKDGRIRGYYSGMDDDSLKKLVADIRRLHKTI